MARRQEPTPYRTKLTEQSGFISQVWRQFLDKIFSDFETRLQELESIAEDHEGRIEDLEP